MLEQVKIFYEGWGERWHWGTLVKFPAGEEHPEVCAIEMVYAECLRRCGIATPDTQHFSLPNGLAAFASKRFDRKDGLRVPMQSLAAFYGGQLSDAGDVGLLQLSARHADVHQ